METCDALIVGGGPAGSTCAARLHEAGLDVLVLDAAVFPRQKPCAGWITPAVIATLDLSVDEYATGRTLQPFTGFRTGRIGGQWVETNYDRPVSFGILRREFDDYLLRRSGARFRGGVPVTRLRRLGDSWIVNEEIRAPLLVGAGGHFCPVARLLNGAAKPSEVVTAQELEFRMHEGQQAACRVHPEVPQLYFSRDFRGYGWCLRKGDSLNVGFGRRDLGRLNEHVREFVAFAQQQGLIPVDLPSGWRGHAYLLHEGAPRRLVDDGVLLLGDAAGLAAPSSGEGIRPAVESGLLAAVAILDTRGRYRREDLEPYRAGIEFVFGRRRRLIVRRAPLVAAVAGRLLGVGWFAHHILLKRWFLQSRRPAVVVRGPSSIGPATAARRAS
jgi:flavin-dependent dehydrogenase